MTVRVAVVAALLCLLARAGFAQPTAGILAGLSTQSEGQPDSHLDPPFGGTSVALIGLVDAPLTTTTTVGFEASLAGAISADQRQRVSGGDNFFRADHSDSIFIATIKLGTPTERVRGAIVGGAGFAARRTTRVGRFQPSFLNGVVAPFAATLSDVVGVVSGGVDLSALAFEHVGLLVGVRVHRLLDDDRDSDGSVRRGVDSTIVRVGAGLLLRF